MGRKESVLLAHEIKPKRSTPVPRKNITLAEAKQNLKAAKAEAVSAKKDVATTMKAFMEAPDKEAGALYRAAVSTHIKTYTAFAKAEDVVAGMAG